MKPQAILKFDLEGNPARMANIVEWLRETAAFLVEHSGEMSDKFRARLFLDAEPFHDVRPVEGSVL